MYDNLDLLGVRYDAELELSAKYDFAEKIASKVKQELKDTNEFHDECIKLISEKFYYQDDIEEVWEIIEENYL